jgi:hypothetical protein
MTNEDVTPEAFPSIRIEIIILIGCFQFEICNLKFEIKAGPTFLGMKPNIFKIKLGCPVSRADPYIS